MWYVLYGKLITVFTTKRPVLSLAAPAVLKASSTDSIPLCRWVIRWRISGILIPSRDDPDTDASAISIALGYAFAYRQVGINVISLEVASEMGRVTLGVPRPAITTDPPAFVAYSSQCQGIFMIEKAAANDILLCSPFPFPFERYRPGFRGFTYIDRSLYARRDASALIYNIRF